MASNDSLCLSSTEQRKILAKEWLNDLIDIDVLFACAICHNAINVNHPIHCPQCSKLFCAGCINRWFNTGPQRTRVYLKGCPCCQAKVTFTQFTHCRVYQEVRELIERLQGNLEQLIQLVAKPVSVCEEHNKELLLFCQQCSKCVCVKCILNAQHSKHIDEILELDDAREKLKATITKENTFLVDRLTALNRAEARIFARERDMHLDHGALLNGLTSAIETMFEKIQEDKDERIKQHLEPIKSVTMRQQKDVEKIIQKTYELASEETSPDVVMKTLQMVDAIKKMHNEPLPVLQLPDTKFVNPISPPPQELHFSMQSFSSRILQSCSVYSLQECIDGFRLQLKGYHDAEEDVIKLALRIVDGYDVNDIKVICYPTRGGDPLVRRLDLKKGDDNTVLEFPDFLSMYGFLDPRSDELHVQMKFNLWATYYDKCAHKDWFIQKLSGGKKEKIGELHRTH